MLVLRLLADLAGALAGAVIRWRTRCTVHEPEWSTWPLCCKHCFQVLDELT